VTANHCFLLIPFLFFAVLVLIRGKPLLRNLILALFGTIILSFLDFHFVNDSILQFESRNYPHTTGFITHSAVASHEVIRPASKFGSISQVSYGVDFKYLYKVNDQSFECARFRYNNYSWKYEWARQLIAVHPVGSQIQVFYNPQNPVDAVLFVGLDGTDMTLFLILALLNLIVIFSWWFLVKKYLKRSVSDETIPTRKF